MTILPLPYDSNASIGAEVGFFDAYPDKRAVSTQAQFGKRQMRPQQVQPFGCRRNPYACPGSQRATKHMGRGKDIGGPDADQRRPIDWLIGERINRPGVAVFANNQRAVRVAVIPGIGYDSTCLPNPIEEACVLAEPPEDDGQAAVAQCACRIDILFKNDERASGTAKLFNDKL